MASSRRREFLRGLVAAGAAGAAVGKAVAQDGSTASAPPAAAAAIEPIDRHELGSTGRSVGIYGLGLGSVFMGAVVNAPEVGDELLRHAVLVRGITYLDTSDDYAAKNAAGETLRSESLIGRVMPQLRDRVFISSKTNARDYDGFLRSYEASLKRLNTDHLDNYNLHCLEPRNDLDKLETGAVKAARELVEQKALGHWGITSHMGAGLLLKAAQRFEPDLITCPFPAGRPDQAAERDLLPWLTEHKIGVVAIKPIRGKRDTPLTGTDLVRYSLSLPGMGVVLVGADSIAHVDGLADLATNFEPLTAEQRAAVDTTVRERVSLAAQTPWLYADYRDGRMV